MFPRVIAFVLALVVAAGVALQTPWPVGASPLAAADVAGVVDDRTADPEPVIAALPPLPEAPVRRELRHVTAPADVSDGRLYLTSVFRPPRRVAFR